MLARWATIRLGSGHRAVQPADASRAIVAREKSLLLWFMPSLANCPAEVDRRPAPPDSSEQRLSDAAPSPAVRDFDVLQDCQLLAGGVGDAVKDVHISNAARERV